MLVYLRNVRTGKIFYLLDKTEFIIGRKNCDLLILNDQSISKRHALITIKNDSVFLKDLGSRYKTVVNGQEVTSNVELALNKGDEIKFGILQSIYRLEILDYTVCCSCINSDGKAKLKEHLTKLKMNFSVEWTPQCTHLTVSSVNLTIKLLLALLDEKPIVRADYWEKCVESLDASTKLPKIEDYLNPPITEPLLSKINLEPNPLRRRLFEGKLFLFYSENMRRHIGEVVTKAGGSSISWEKDKPKDLTAIQQELVVIQVASERSDASYSALIEPYLASGRRLISFEEIPQAIINCSCKKFCNPKLQLAKVVFGKGGVTPPTQSTPLVGETESQAAPTQRGETEECVPETMSVEAELAESKSEKRRGESNEEGVEVPAKRVKVSRSCRNEPSSSNAGATTTTTSLTKPLKQSMFPKQITSNQAAPVKKPTPPPSPVSQKRKQEDSADTPFAFFSKKAKNQPEQSEPKKNPPVQPEQVSNRRLEEPTPRSTIQAQKPCSTIQERTPCSTIQAQKPCSTIQERTPRSIVPESDTSSDSVQITAQNHNFSINSSRVVNGSNGTWFVKKSPSKSRDYDDENDGFDEDTKNIINRMNMAVIISDFNSTRDVSSKPNVTLNQSSSGVKNFKCFKKVMPLNKQRQVIQGSQFELANIGIKKLK